MAEVKTKVTDVDPRDYLNTIEPEKKRKEGFVLLEMFEKATGEPAKMWGPTMVGFGQYHYKSERSSQEADWFLSGFSPRKQSLTLYVISDQESQVKLLEKLGKHTKSVGCLYINKLDDVDLTVLAQLVTEAYQYHKKQLVG